MPCSGLVLWLGASLTGDFFRALFWLAVLWLGASFVSCFGFPVLASSVKTCTFSRRATATCHRGIAGAAQKRKLEPGKHAQSIEAPNSKHTAYRGGSTHIRAQNFASPHGGRHFKELHISAGITHHPNLNPAGGAGFCWSSRKRRNLAKPRGRHCSRHGLLPFDAALMRLGSDSRR